VFEGTSTIKALFATYGVIVIGPLDDVVILALNGPIKNVAIETSNLSMAKESTSTYRWR
jgi:hypothetical protein